MAKIFDFQLFADGATGDGAVAPAENSLENNSGGEQIPETAKKGSDAGNNTSAESDGQTDHAAREKEFEDLIRGNYKSQFENKVQNIIDRRFKAQKGVMEEYAAAKPILDMLMQRYNTSDIAALKEAFEGDTSYWEAGAEKEGMDVNQYKEIMQLRAENQRFRQEHEMTEQQKYIQNQIDDWKKQGDELKSVYPEFDFQTELANKDFQGLLKAGIPMKKAYEIMHMEEIQAALKEQTEKTVMDHIRANGSRPSENGVKSSNSFVLGKNVSDLTKADRDEIKRRVQRGEKIIL